MLGMPYGGMGVFFLNQVTVGVGTPSAGQLSITSWFTMTGTSTLFPDPLILAGSVQEGILYYIYYINMKKEKKDNI